MSGSFLRVSICNKETTLLMHGHREKPPTIEPFLFNLNKVNLTYVTVESIEWLLYDAGSHLNGAYIILFNCYFI